jgi:hypothetical protein
MTLERAKVAVRGKELMHTKPKLCEACDARHGGRDAPPKETRYSVTEEAKCCQESSYIHHQTNKQNYMIDKSRDTLVHESTIQFPSILPLLLQKVCTEKLLSALVLQSFCQNGKAKINEKSFGTHSASNLRS